MFKQKRIRSKSISVGYIGAGVGTPVIDESIVVLVVNLGRVLVIVVLAGREDDTLEDGSADDSSEEEPDIKPDDEDNPTEAELLPNAFVDDTFGVEDEEDESIATAVNGFDKVDCAEEFCTEELCVEDDAIEDDGFTANVIVVAAAEDDLELEMTMVDVTDDFVVPEIVEEGGGLNVMVVTAAAFIGTSSSSHWSSSSFVISESKIKLPVFDE